MTYIPASLPTGSSAYTEQFRKEGDEWGIISPVHRLHPIRLVETIRFNTINELRGAIGVGLDLINLNRTIPDISYAGGINSTFRPHISKPEITIHLSDSGERIIGLAATATVPVDMYNSTSVADAIKGLMWRKIDAFEAIIWWGLLGSLGIELLLPQPANSFRELFALGRSMLARMVPDDEVYALLSSRAYGAMLLDNAAGANQDNALNPFDQAAGTLRVIPVATNYLPPQNGGSYLFETIVIYPASLISATKRYIRENIYEDEIVDATEDRNLIRVTCERYLFPVFPTDYYTYSGGIHSIPAVSLRAQDAINAIANKYNAGTLANLDYVSSLV